MRYNFTPTGDLRICLSQGDDAADFDEAIMPMLENGWDLIPPGAIGALTDSPILSDNVEWDDDHELVLCAERVFWYPNYVITDPFDEMRTKRGVIFTKVDAEC